MSYVKFSIARRTGKGYYNLCIVEALTYFICHVFGAKYDPELI